MKKASKVFKNLVGVGHVKKAKKEEGDSDTIEKEAEDVNAQDTGNENDKEENKAEE